MRPSRVWVVITGAVYLAWLGWLGYAVYGARWAPDRTPVVSRAQLVGATHLLVCDVTTGADGLPEVSAKVAEVLRGDGVKVGDTVEVWNLPSSQPPGADGTPAGRYLLPLVGGGAGYKVAGLPRSPGYEPAESVRPVVYRWTPGLGVQLRSLAIRP